MGRVDVDRLIAACADDSAETGVRIETSLEPVGGPSARVQPAIYAGGRFQEGRRWWGQGEKRSVVDTITIDNTPSQANRLEAALETHRGELGLPEFRLDLSDLEPLPPHVPRAVSSLRFPHRNADAYLRDSQLDGVDFRKTDVGRAVFDATADSADALMRWFPQALLFGFWQSHLGKKGSQAKLARSWVSEIVGLNPAAKEVRTLGVKGDPLNLSAPGSVVYDENAAESWELVDKGKKNLSDIGHGQVPFSDDDAALSGVSFEEIVQRSSVSFASLRRVHTSMGSGYARAVLVALGLVAHLGAFGRSFSLRSGAELRPVSSTWTWLGASGDEDLDPLDPEEATALFLDVVRAAREAGAPVGEGHWGDPVRLTPKQNLAKAIRTTFPVPEDE